jgi:hypothetical protein
VDVLTVLGVISTGAAIVFYHLEPRHSLWVLGFAIASFSSAVYAILQGAWPFFVAELFWTAVAMHRYVLLVRGGQGAYVPGAARNLEAAVEDERTPAAAVVPACHAGYRLRPLSAAREDASRSARARGGAERVARVS